MIKEYYEKYWNHKLPANIKFYGKEPEWNEESLNRIERMIVPWLKAGNLIDFGCGEGHLANRMSRHMTTFGGDISEVAIKKARKNYDLNFFVMPNKLPVMFSNLICTEVIEHILDFDDFFAQVKSYLCIGGRMMVTSPEMCFCKFLAIGLFFRHTFFHPYSPHIRFFTKRTLRELFEYHGFKVLHYERLGNYFGLISKGQFVVAERLL